MAEETTTFLLSSVVDSPDIVLRRFQRCIILEQQNNDNKDSSRELVLKLSSLRESYREKEIAVDRLNARYEKLLSDVESQEEELQRLCDWEASLAKQLENLSHQSEDAVNSMKAAEDEAARIRDRISLYEKTFGIKIARTKGQGDIQIIFYGCCEGDPDRLSYAALRLDPDSTAAKIIKCNPPITDVEKLIRHLNDIGDFRSFLLILRHRFVRYFQHRKTADRDREETPQRGN